MGKDLCYDRSKNGVYLKVKVIPRASSNRVLGLAGDRIRISVTAAPRDGEANEAAATLISEVFGLKKSRCAVTSGFKSSGKVVFIEADVENEIKKMFYAAERENKEKETGVPNSN
jgi:uncharacterized protein (TIGR00251 family)